MLLSTSDEILVSVHRFSNQETCEGFLTVLKDTQTLILKNGDLFHIIKTPKIITGFYWSGLLSYT